MADPIAKIHLQTKDLAVGYHGQALIRHIDLDICRGEIVTLIGPNGAGKSTILKSIIRQLEPVAGTVFLDMDRGLRDLSGASYGDRGLRDLSGASYGDRGLRDLSEASHGAPALRDLSGVSYGELARHMAVVLTDRTETELMTCWEVAAAGRYPYTGRFGILTREDREKIDAALRAVRADTIADRQFSAISDGQRQRVLLARAFCQEPEIIVLDEPTSFLDIRYKLDLLTALRDMAKNQEITVILSLHEIDLAMKISDRIVCVGGDEILGVGAPEEVFQEETIRSLYGIESGSYDPLFGSVELEKMNGEPRVFVLSSGGRGIPVYRRLQRERIPFAAGILYENDMDYHVARRLAAELVSEKAFRTISEEKVREAIALMRCCGQVINAGFELGDCNQAMQRLAEEAEGLTPFSFSS